MYIVAASFLGFFCFTIYAEIVRPELAGFDADYAEGHLHLNRVWPASALERAGVRDGDRILTVDGDAIHTLDDWGRVRALFRAGQPIDLEVERQGTRFRASLVLKRDAWISVIFGADTTAKVDYFGWHVAGLLPIVFSFLVFLRPYDLSARLVSLVWAAFAASGPMAIVTHVPDRGWAAAWHSLRMRGGLRGRRGLRGLQLMLLAVMTNALRHAEDIVLAADVRAFQPEHSRCIPIRAGRLDGWMGLAMALTLLGVLFLK